MEAINIPTPIHRASEDPASVPAGERTPQQVADLLRRPFAPGVIKQRPLGNGQSVDYAPIDAVLDRLNRATLEWHWEVTRVEILTMPIRRKEGVIPMPVCHVAGQLSIPGLGTRQGIGTAPCEGTEDAAKIAESDAIKRAATMFGVPGGR